MWCDKRSLNSVLFETCKYKIARLHDYHIAIYVGVFQTRKYTGVFSAYHCKLQNYAFCHWRSYIVNWSIWLGSYTIILLTYTNKLRNVTYNICENNKKKFWFLLTYFKLPISNLIYILFKMILNLWIIFCFNLFQHNYGSNFISSTFILYTKILIRLDKIRFSHVNKCQIYQ